MTKRIGPKETAARQLRERPRSKRKEVIVSQESRHNHSAETYAPAGQCEFCDRRKAGAAESMRRSRKKRKKAEEGASA